MARAMADKRHAPACSSTRLPAATAASRIKAFPNRDNVQRPEGEAMANRTMHARPGSKRTH
jgi:hypothetical protein